MVANPSLAPLHPEEDSAKRRQIMEGAHRVFMELGFDGASMGEIARAAGVSKGTLYVYFADKFRLFEAIVEQECLEQGKATFDLDPAKDPESVLSSFGRAYIDILCRPGGGSSVRMVMAIAERMPDVGRGFYDRVIAHTVNRLADYLQIKVQEKKLVIDDCGLAAAQFMELCKSTLFLPYIFHAEPAPSPQQIATVIDSATRMFLATYGPKSV